MSKDSIHNAGLTRPVSIMFTEAKEAPLMERLVCCPQMLCYLKWAWKCNARANIIYLCKKESRVMPWLVRFQSLRLSRTCMCIWCLVTPSLKATPRHQSISKLTRLENLDMINVKISVFILILYEGWTDNLQYTNSWFTCQMVWILLIQLICLYNYCIDSVSARQWIKPP